MREDELPRAMENFERALATANSQPGRQGGRLCFARPRSLPCCAIGAYPGLQPLTVSFCEGGPGQYRGVLGRRRCSPSQLLMPTIETTVAFSRDGLSALAEHLQRVASRVLAVRIGGNDLLSILRIRRTRGQTIYDTPLRRVIDDVLCAFKPRGFGFLLQCWI